MHVSRKKREEREEGNAEIHSRAEAQSRRETMHVSRKKREEREEGCRVRDRCQKQGQEQARYRVPIYCVMEVLIWL
jgi:hypothetical protein